MNVIEAIEAAKSGKAIRRPSWPKDKKLFWKDGTLWIRHPYKGYRLNSETDPAPRGGWPVQEDPLLLFTADAVLATDWKAVKR